MFCKTRQCYTTNFRTLGLVVSDEENFYKSIWPQVLDQVWPQSHDFGRGLQDNTTNQTSKPKALWFHTRRFFSNPFHCHDICMEFHDLCNSERRTSKDNSCDIPLQSAQWYRRCCLTPNEDDRRKTPEPTKHYQTYNQFDYLLSKKQDNTESQKWLSIWPTYKTVASNIT